MPISRLVSCWAVSIALLAPPLLAQQASRIPPRIAQNVDNARLVTLRGNTHPLARAEYDQGAAPQNLPMERILLTASTSEAYAYLFKLLANPGDAILVPRPSYPLFEFLADIHNQALCGHLHHMPLDQLAFGRQTDVAIVVEKLFVTLLSARQVDRKVVLVGIHLEVSQVQLKSRLTGRRGFLEGNWKHRSAAAFRHTGWKLGDPDHSPPLRSLAPSRQTVESATLQNYSRGFRPCQPQRGPALCGHIGMRRGARAWKRPRATARAAALNVACEGRPGAAWRAVLRAPGKACPSRTGPTRPGSNGY